MLTLTLTLNLTLTGNSTHRNKSSLTGLVPYHFDPEYFVEKFNSSQQWIAETTVEPSPFSVWLQQSFLRTLITHLKYCLCFLLKICVKNFMVWKCCLSLDILESVSLENVICYRHKGTRTDGVMLIMQILCSSILKEFHKMAAPIKIKIVQLSVWLYYWLFFKNRNTNLLHLLSEINTTYGWFLSPVCNVNHVSRYHKLIQI